ncbi:hypothetical protein ACHWQZ_G018999 [Mnemiopsis leidyi]
MAEFYSLEQSQDFTDVFLSHDWGTDEQGRNNHERVSAVNDALKQLGYKTWFDSDRMTGDIVDTLCDGIDNTRLVLVFVTQKYAKEVQSGQDNDTKKLEFKYAMRRKGATKMIPIIMEERMKNSGDWKGPIGLTLGGILSVKMFFDFDDVAKFKGGMKDLKKEIDNRLKMLQADIPHIPISSLAISAPTPPLSAQRPIQPAIEIPSSSASRVQTTPVQPQPGPATPASQPGPATPASQPAPATPASQPCPATPASQPAPVTPASEAAPVKQSSETILTIPRICNGKITGAYSLDLKELRFK